VAKNILATIAKSAKLGGRRDARRDNKILTINGERVYDPASTFFLFMHSRYTARGAVSTSPVEVAPNV
jgi:hypothetical protein